MKSMLLMINLKVSYGLDSIAMKHSVVTLTYTTNFLRSIIVPISLFMCIKLTSVFFGFDKSDSSSFKSGFPSWSIFKNSNSSFFARFEMV